MSAEHGTAYRYEQGCRCDECRTASTAKRKFFRDRARSRHSEAYLKDLAASREWKRRQHGHCRSCGAETSYNGHPGKLVSDLCIPCANAEIGLRLRGRGDVSQRALAYLTEPRRYSELRDHLGISDQYVSQVLYGRLLSYGFVKRLRRGVYVSTAAGRDALEQDER